MRLRKNIYRLFAIAAGLALGGCLISEAPLLDAKNGRARPLDPGLYEACEHDGEGGEPECKEIDIRRDGAGLYGLRAEGEDETTLARFRRIARGAFLAQLNGSEDEDEDYFYFIGETAGEDFVMAMIVCEDIPEAVRAKYSARGEMEVDEDASTCVVNTLRAATAAAKAYRAATKPESRSRIVYRKLCGAPCEKVESGFSQNRRDHE